MSTGYDYSDTWRRQTRARMGRAGWSVRALAREARVPLSTLKRTIRRGSVSLEVAIPVGMALERYELELARMAAEARA